MATQGFSTSDNLTKKLWDEKLFRDVEKEAYFTKFHGSSADSLVHEKTQLEKDQGDRIRFGLSMRITGPGVTGGQILENNEEDLTLYSQDVTLEQYRNAVRYKRGIDEKRAMFSISEEAKARIKNWGAEKIDQLHFDALFDSSPSNVFYRESSAGAFTKTGTAATAKSGLSATNSKLTPNFIMQLATWAKTGGARTGGQVPVRPVRVEGKDYFVLLAHPDIIADLKQDSTYQNFMRDAAERGKSNPLFTGAVSVLDGVVIHSHENCPIGTDGGGGSVAWGQASLMGAQSLIWAWGRRPNVVSKDYDYDNETGVAIDMICKAARPVFNSKDYGSLRIYLARSNVSGA